MTFVQSLKWSCCAAAAVLVGMSGRAHSADLVAPALIPAAPMAAGADKKPAPPFAAQPAAAAPKTPAAPTTPATAPATPAGMTSAAGAAAVADPLAPDIAEAKVRLETMERDIQDYSCTLIKREHVDGKLQGYEAMFTKVRQKPFSVYMYFLSPAEKKGQQVVYIDGRNDGNLIAQPVGLTGRLGPFTLPPTGYLAMQGQRYPITEVGFINLTRRLIEVGKQNGPPENCVVKHYENVKVKTGSGDPRICRLTEVTHPTKREGDRYYMARIYIDKQMNIPIRFESYDWPSTEGGKPEVLEEYTYSNVKLNNNFTDDDFQIRK
ncbi:MAG: DUF1571 domain-containing protein [Planctomycetia bacterium]|nr:DUF1571 domain-containing protein [Planctomycetia bacterium]